MSGTQIYNIMQDKTKCEGGGRMRQRGWEKAAGNMDMCWGVLPHPDAVREESTQMGAEQREWQVQRP